MMSIADPAAIDIEKSRIDSWCSSEKDLIKLIHINHLMVLHQIFNEVDSCHNCVRGPLT